MTDEADCSLTGAAYELASSGFRPMPDKPRKDEEEAIGGDIASLRAAAEKNSKPSEEIVVRAYVDDDGRPAPANEAITIDRAARDYAGASAAEKVSADNESNEALAARIDAMRSEAMVADPEAAELYGFDPPEKDAGQNINGKTEFEELNTEAVDRSGDSIEGLEAEIEKAMQHPQVRQAIEEKIEEAERARQDYRSGLATATQIAQVSFINQFPELANIAPEHLPGALELMSQQDPARFARVEAMIVATEGMLAQQAQHNLHEAEIAQRSFHDYARLEDERFEAMVKGESKETRQAVTAEIFASAKVSGVEAGELTRLFNNEPVMRNAVFQRMMYEAGKYRMMLKAKDTAAARAVPPVQRPGMARTAAEREHADLRTLNSRLSTTGDIKDAVALYHARKAGRRN